MPNTHDADFDAQYDARGLARPAAAREHRAHEAQTREQLELARRATDEHIEALPALHQPIVRMLRQAAKQKQQQQPG